MGAIVDALFIYLFVGIAVGALVFLLPGEGAQPSPIELSLAIGIAVVAVLIPVVINCVLIAKSGQSIGKKAVGTRMIDQETSTQVGVVQGYVVRTIAFGCLTGIPIVGGIIVFFLEWLQSDVLRTIADVERAVGAPALGAIPAGSEAKGGERPGWRLPTWIEPGFLLVFFVGAVIGAALGSLIVALL